MRAGCPRTAGRMRALPCTRKILLMRIGSCSMALLWSATFRALRSMRTGCPRSNSMCTDRRDFLRLSAGVAGAALIGSKRSFAATDDVEDIQQRQDVPDLIQRLKKMTAGVVPIADD